MSYPYFPKKEPIKSIFKQTSPDEDQSLEGSPTFTVLMKGYKTRSCIYERLLPDGESGALRINGPRGSNAAMIFDNLGTIKIKTGLKTSVAGSGIFGIKSSGQQQLHNGRSNIQYNAGGTEDDGQALNVLAYGDVVEQCIGGSRYIKASKILLTATDSLIIRSNNINLEAAGELNMVGGTVTQIQVNRKDIISGQDMKFGAGEDTTMQFDPRSQVNIISTGSVNHKVLQDYKLRAFGCLSLYAVGGPGALIKNRTVGASISTKTKFAAGGNLGSDLVSSAKVKVDGITGVEIGSNANVDVVGDASTFIGSSGEVEISGTSVDIDASANITLSGALIYLN